MDTTAIEKITRVYPRREMTANPIFLLQEKRYTRTEVDIDDDFKESGDGDFLDLRPLSSEERFLYENGNPDDVELDCVSDDELEDMGILVSCWDTTAIFFTREEAEQYAQDRCHNYGAKNIDWRVWCSSAAGQLAEILDKHTVKKED